MTPRELGCAAGAVLVALGGGYCVGRYAAPDKVVITEKVRTVEVEKLVVQERVRVERVEVQAAAAATRKETTRVRHADGSTETRTVQQAAQVALSEQHQVGEGDASITHSRSQEKVSEASQSITRDRPSWRAHVMVGAAFNTGPLPSSLLRAGPVYGGALQRRVLGPVSVGVWGLSSGQGGASVGLEW